jgi:hypothetical protein
MMFYGKENFVKSNIEIRIKDKIFDEKNRMFNIGYDFNSFANQII